LHYYLLNNRWENLKNLKDIFIGMHKKIFNWFLANLQFIAFCDINIFWPILLLYYILEQLRGRIQLNCKLSFYMVKSGSMLRYKYGFWNQHFFISFEVPMYTLTLTGHFWWYKQCRYDNLSIYNVMIWWRHHY